MTQQISYEEAFPTVEKRCHDLFAANLLLEAKVDVLARRVAALAEENERLKQGTADAGPSAGPGLAAAPPYASDEPA